MDKRRKIVVGVIVGVLAVGGIIYLATPSKARQREAIERALMYDQACAARKACYYAKNTGFWDGVTVLLGDVENTAMVRSARQYADELKRIPLDGCPKEFKEAYEMHIMAWHNLDSANISTSWYQIAAIARKYDVDRKLLEP